MSHARRPKSFSLQEKKKGREREETKLIHPISLEPKIPEETKLFSTCPFLPPCFPSPMMNVDLAHMQRSLDNLSVHDFVPGTVSWSDGDRGVCEDGSLSCFGSNNTDAKLKGKHGKVYPYLRSPNYDETLGVTTADKVVIGVEDGREKTAQDVLMSLDERGRKQGNFEISAVISEKHPVVVRVMNAFVPLSRGQEEEYVVPTHYSYQTFDTPRNLLVCGHKGGIDLQADARGDNPLYSLKKGRDGSVSQHFYKVYESDNEVGTGPVSLEGGEGHGVGIKGMGKRDNVFCIMSVPNKYTPPILRSFQIDEDGAEYRSLSATSHEGVAKAAILGVDDENVGFVSGKKQKIEYGGEEAIVITLLYYNTIRSVNADHTGSVAVPPLAVAAAVNDMKKAYSLCDDVGKLSNLGAMLIKMTETHYSVVKRKLKEDAPSLPSRSKFTFKKEFAAILAKELV